MPPNPKSCRKLFKLPRRGREVLPVFPPQSTSDPQPPTTISNNFVINCWMLGAEAEQVIDISISPNETVGALKRAVITRNHIDVVRETNVILYRVFIPCTLELADHVPPLEQLRSMTLSPAQKLSAAFTDGLPDEYVHVIIGIRSGPQMPPPLQGGPILRDAVAGPVSDPDIIQFLGSCRNVIINVASDEPNRAFSVEDVRGHGFVGGRNTNHPEFVETFWRDMLGRLDIRIDRSDDVPDPSNLFEALPQRFREGLHHLTSGDEEWDVERNGLDTLCHLLSTASFEERFWSKSYPQRLSEEDTKYIFLNRFAKSTLLPDETRCLFRQPWPLSLAVKVDGNTRLKTYTPRSDFSIWVNGFPRLVWEICSDQTNHRDQLRMQAYGTSIVKLGNCILRDSGEQPRFILVTIYQADSGTYLSVFYEEDRKIYQREEKFDLTSMIHRYEFTRRLYKLAKIFKSDNRNALYEHSFVRGLAAYVKTNEFDGTIFSRKSGSGGPVEGYELISDVIMDGKGVFEPLWKLPPNIHRMRRHDDTSMTLYVVKESRQGSDEAKILKFLQTLKPPCKHIISLIETLETNAGTYIVLPERQSVKEQLHCFTDGGNLRGMFLDLSRDLTIGLSFLHKNGIAHLDIKPSNLVYTSSE